MLFTSIQGSTLECKGERQCYYYQDNLESVLIYFLKENKSLSTFVALLLGVRVLEEEHFILLAAGARILLSERIAFVEKIL